MKQTNKNPDMYLNGLFLLACALSVGKKVIHIRLFVDIEDTSVHYLRHTKDNKTGKCAIFSSAE
jgi:hypothetical protein